jgi:hypothetical protein
MKSWSPARSTCYVYIYQQQGHHRVATTPIKIASRSSASKAGPQKHGFVKLQAAPGHLPVQRKTKFPYDMCGDGRQPHLRRQTVRLDSCMSAEPSSNNSSALHLRITEQQEYQKSTPLLSPASPLPAVPPSSPM